MDEQTLRDAATAWIATAPHDDEPDAVRALLARDDIPALRELFAGSLDFGTGGMRGTMGPGTLRMNRVMIRRVTAALGAAVLARDPTAAAKGAVLAYDARHRSKVFAEDAARVLAALGFTVHIAPDPQPTPILGFATTHLGGAVGIVVTASHNPATDNGYKVFDGRGAQIVAPFDEEVCGRMASLPARVPLADDALAKERIVAWSPDVLDAYHRAVLALRVGSTGPLRIVYTPVHGVGGVPALRVLAEAGYTDVHPVAEQIAPDPTFPTVPFPNPEEPGVLRLAIARATQISAHLVLANDPDADRLAVAVPDGAGGWHQLTGNQLGVLLADEILGAEPRTVRDLVATTIVSTGMLGRLAQHHDVSCAETLTGFKWIAQAALAHESGGGAFVFGFEESIGYTAGTVVRDKDGISTALLAADLAAKWHRRGLTLLDALQALYEAHGLHVSRPVSLKRTGLDGLAEIRAAMTRLRTSPPPTLGGQRVVTVRDVLTGVATQEDGSTMTVDLPRSDVLWFDLADGSRALIRPSGTEPKIKLYLEGRVELPHGTPWRSAEAQVVGALDQISRDLQAAAGL